MAKTYGTAVQLINPDHIEECKMWDTANKRLARARRFDYLRRMDKYGLFANAYRNRWNQRPISYALAAEQRRDFYL